ncbi:hypothetical protein Cgig2_009444 [Carnegiea gigantea]|uniref:Uncharacterized protein n=1 Tax=Carnegiea gigantea TaxID=171969 RepID=A0A9Q1GJ26_9CARY|nr:hypothetical protein Cgig2_009444 [Carnegiea gigantea]
MTVMTYTITRQVSEQVQRATKAANLARPLPHFDYPSHWHARAPSPHDTKRDREASQLKRSGPPYTGNHYRHAAAVTRPSSHPARGQTTKSTTASTPYATHSRWTVWFEEQEQTSKPRGKISALHELADKGQIDHFLKEGPHFIRGEREAAQPKPQDEEYSTEVKAAIAGGYIEGITWSAWKAQLRGAQQLKARNLEVDFLVVNVPTTYNVILGRPTPYKIKARRQEKIILEEFNLGSQLQGSLSLGLLLFLSSPCTDSITLAMNLGMGLGRSSSRIYHFLLLVGRLSEGVPDWLLFIPARKVPPTQVSVNEEEPGLLLKQYHRSSPVSLGALWMVWTRANAREVHMRPRSSHIAMKERMLCQDVGIICAGASSNLLKISTINGWRGIPIVISHGYETSTLGLRMLGVEEY